MIEERAAIKKPINKKYTALRALCTAKDGMVKAGDICTCTLEESEKFKLVKAI